MTFTIGRSHTGSGAPAGRLGSYRALDGTAGAPLWLDFDAPHAVLIVGKRGYGKSYTMGVVAEALSQTTAIAPVLIDPMGGFRTLDTSAGGDHVHATVIASPTVRADSLDPRSWCTVRGLTPESGPGGLVWQAAQAESTLAGMRDHVGGATAPNADKRAAINHLTLAMEWEIFDPNGLRATELGGSEITVLDLSALDTAPMNAVTRAVGEALYRARLTDTMTRLPWLLIDEAHTFFGGIAAETLNMLLTRGRAPGVSVVLATQRPSAIPEVGLSQADILITHRLTSQADFDALEAAKPTYMADSLAERMPTDPGEVVIIDDATETVHTARIRKRRTPHGGNSPRASQQL